MDMKWELDGAVAIVTGAGSGLGRSIAMALARAGARVVAADIHETGAQETAAAIQRAAGREDAAFPVQVDVSDEQSVTRMVRQVIERFGRIDAVINNAGITDMQHRPVRDLPTEVWQRILAVNLTGPFLVSKAVVGDMIARRRGNIVNVTSVLGVRGWAHRGDAAYCASKAGLEQLTEVLAKELRPYGINVNSLCPLGRIRSGFFAHLPEEEQARIEDPDLAGEPAVFLSGLKPYTLTGRTVAMEWWHSNPEYRSQLIAEHDILSRARQGDGGEPEQDQKGVA